MGTIHIDADEFIDQIDDDDLLDEVRRRKLNLGVPQTPFGSSYVELAYEALKAGRSSEALALLDRALFPTGATLAPDGQLQFKASP